MARPKIEIDPKLIENLAAIHCTMKEIAAVVECSVDTLERRFAEAIEKGRDRGKTQLRKGLWQLAAKGNLGALIWLSKQHLGMSEKVEQKTEDVTPHEQVPIVCQLVWGDEINAAAAIETGASAQVENASTEKNQ